MTAHLADFNLLVREAHAAQEAFDKWDQGITYDRVGGLLYQRNCTLDEVSREWSEANCRLIEFALEHGEHLLAMEKPK